MTDFPTAKLISPELADIKDFERRVKDEYDIEGFNASEPYEIYIEGSSRLLRDLNSVEKLRKYSQDLDAIVALHHLDSDISEEEANEEIGWEESVRRADEMQPGFAQNIMSMFDNDIEEVEEEPEINRRFGSFQNYLEGHWKTTMEGYNPQVFTKRFDAEVENLDPALSALEAAEKVVKESGDYSSVSFGFYMNLGHDDLDEAYQLLNETADAVMVYHYTPEDKEATLSVSRIGINSQRTKGNPGGWDTELAQKVEEKL